MMPSVEKLIEKMKRQPNGISIDEINKVLNHFDFKCKRQKGSHRTYRNDHGGILVIPVRKPTIKPVYVKNVLEKIEE